MAAGELRMSELAARSASARRRPAGWPTASSSSGCLTRHDDPARPPPGRRHDDARRPRAPGALPGTQPAAAPRAADAPRRRRARRRRPLAGLLGRAIDRTVTTDNRPPAGDPIVSRLSRLAVSKRSVTLLFAAALFVAGISAWGSLKQELLPDIEFPVITIVAPYPGAGSSDVTEQVTKPIERAVGSVPRLDVHPVDVVELDLAGRRPVRVRDRRQAPPRPRSRTRSPRRSCPASVDADRPGPEHQRLAGRHLVDRGDESRRPRRGRDDRPDRDRPRDRSHRRRGQGRPHRRPRARGWRSPSTRPSWPRRGSRASRSSPSSAPTT